MHWGLLSGVTVQGIIARGVIVQGDDHKDSDMTQKDKTWSWQMQRTQIQLSIKKDLQHDLEDKNPVKRCTRE